MSILQLRALGFCLVILVLCWFGMMAIHELGHVIGAMVTGGAVQKVVLHPLSISRTDVTPNPHPAWVVWMGPVLGCLLPLGAIRLVPRSYILYRNFWQFFAGFCLIANGAYISIGAFDRVGDCGEMLRTGTPFPVLILYGSITIPLGFLLWHRLGSPMTLYQNPMTVTSRMLQVAIVTMIIAIVAGATLSSR